MSLPSSFVALTKSIFFLFSIFITISEAAASTPLVLYNFNEGNGSEIHDVSGNGTPLNLKIRDPDNVRWLQGGGLAVDRPTLIKTTGPAGKIINAIKASNALTIEAWIQPSSKTQTGPARIITLSADTRNRNLTLGQDKSAYDIRLRTTKTSDNGTPSLHSEKDTVDTALTHVVYTRNSRGVARLYVDGVMQSKKRIKGSLRNWETSYGLALANEFTGNRSWTGTFYQVAIYSRALSEPEIIRSFNTGTSDSEPLNSYDTNFNPIDSTSSDNTTSSISDSEQTTTLPDSSTTDSNATVTLETGSILLDWNIPVTRRDGEALSMNEIAGYTIYYGDTTGSYPYSVSINGAYITSTTITELPLGTYYFVITARDTIGQESQYSNIATKPVL